MSAPDFSIGSSKWPGVTKLIEECGEVLQVLGKLQATGGEPKHWDGTDLGIRLEEELGDLLAAIAFVIEKNEAISPENVARRSAQKIKQFMAWHKEQ